MPSRILVEGQMDRQVGEAARIQTELTACEIDEELRPFLAPLRSTVRHPHLVVALQLWRRASNLSLLPFHLHLRWPDEIAYLPLFTSVYLAPFFSADVEQAELMPLYKRARSSRGQDEGAKGRPSVYQVLTSARRGSHGGVRYSSRHRIFSSPI